MLGTINEKALQELGWPRLCAELASRSRTPMGRERAQSLLPHSDPDVARQQLALVEEARLLRRHDRELPLADAVDVRPSLGRAAREGTLEPSELLQVARLIRAGDSARRFCFSQADRAPLHFERAQELSELVPLAQELERAFDPAGKLLDTASALLAELRERARGLHRAIKQRIEEMLKDENVVAMLRDLYYSVRGDRYVLPVRAEHRSHLPGIVHNASNSGQTLFVEPQQLVELGNQLTIAEAGALEEEQRILHELSGAVGRRAPALEHDVETIAVLDEAAAGGRLADDLEAGAPELGGDRFDLRKARHPLLVLQRKSAGVVANDIALPAPAQALIVSGPNAGGKTVTITGVGLCALMARAGLPIPAEAGSRMPLYRTVYTAIGDEGDLSRDLSTFTAHLSALKWILEAAGPGTLALIDEIAADTDPREGAAIAVAALEKLVVAGAQVLITRTSRSSRRSRSPIRASLLPAWGSTSIGSHRHTGCGSAKWARRRRSRSHGASDCRRTSAPARGRSWGAAPPWFPRQWSGWRRSARRRRGCGGSWNPRGRTLLVSAPRCSASASACASWSRRRGPERAAS